VKKTLRKSEVAGAGHRDDSLFEDRGPALGQRLQMGSFCINAFARHGQRCNG
jgi:hypothetical protein